MAALLSRIKKSCSQINKSELIYQTANRCSKFGLFTGAISLGCVASTHHLPNVYIVYSLQFWLGCRTVSYFFKKSRDEQFGVINGELGVSQDVKMVVFCSNSSIFSEFTEVPTSKFSITQLNQIQKIEFIASRSILRKFILFAEQHKKNISYTILPIYRKIKRVTVNSVPLDCDLKISDFVQLVVFTPKKCFDSVKLAICQNKKEQLRPNAPSTYFEQGTARWKNMGVFKQTGSYASNDKDAEFKLITEIHRSDLLRVLRSVARVHIYNEIGYDVYPTYKPNVEKNKTCLFNLTCKISKFAKYLFYIDTELQNSNNFKLIVSSPNKLADRVRAVIVENGGGVIGNYAHCSFTIGEDLSEECNKGETKTQVLIETIVDKEVVKIIIVVLKTIKEISFNFHPIYERIETKSLRNNFFSSIIHFFTS